MFGAKYEIYELIINMAKQGKTIIVVSSEMPEILGITNRIGVMSNGHLAGIVNTKETNQGRVIKTQCEIFIIRKEHWIWQTVVLSFHSAAEAELFEAD